MCMRNSRSQQFRDVEQNSACIAATGRFDGSQQQDRSGPNVRSLRQRGDVKGALSHLRVVEIGSSPAASYCARLYADFGAEVQKVEPPAGDPLRRAAPLTPKGQS